MADPQTPSDASTQFLATASQFNASLGSVIGGFVRAGVEADAHGRQANVNLILAQVQTPDGKPRPPLDFVSQVSGPAGKPLVETHISVPLIAITENSSFLPTSATLTLDMEVASHAQDSTKVQADIEASGEAGIGIGPFKADVHISAKVSVSKDHSRSSDYSSKTHAEVIMGRVPMPEGLARIIDSLNRTVAKGLDLAERLALAKIDAQATAHAVEDQKKAA